MNESIPIEERSRLGDGNAPAREHKPARSQAACKAERPEQSTCPACGVAMRLWAGFYRCRNCGFKESCCF
jgi:hypothetical protein